MKRGERVRYYGITDTGLLRKENQDKIYLPDDDNDLKFFIVADGMGGVKGGEIASSIAIDTVKNYISENINNIELTHEEILKLINDSIKVANSAIYDRAVKEPKYTGMGTTIVVAVLYKNRIYIGHVGDSRIYRIRKNIIRQLTNDHSYVQALYREGTITKQEAENHPQKNILIKVVGCEEEVEPDIISKGFLQDDILLMCTDGLTNMVQIEDIFNIVTEKRNNLKDACEKLINMANENGRI